MHPLKHLPLYLSYEGTDFPVVGQVGGGGGAKYAILTCVLVEDLGRLLEAVGQF